MWGFRNIINRVDKELYLNVNLWGLMSLTFQMELAVGWLIRVPVLEAWGS